MSFHLSYIVIQIIIVKGHSISILEALRLVGHNELDWLGVPPEYLRIDVVVFHGVKLGHQAVVIRKSPKCKWVDTDPEELVMFKCTGKKKA